MTAKGISKEEKDLQYKNRRKDHQAHVAMMVILK